MGQEGIDDHVQVGFSGLKNAIGFMKHKNKENYLKPYTSNLKNDN